ncbi:hypothetical protein [Flavobacterium sedimenticola]|uniref:Uncharacterized protein n=1 Tax=Flavobacterium sedimenticola TaxID=3043286 RepID=A0ABT6XMN4_9FLAO|nr:hypothetical protein [Flavobacterium sedimenticola]MDI9256347.1 hypothetical protein [Flavobacterium sedimenticola]
MIKLKMTQWQLIDEYILIINKKSKLSRAQRDLIENKIGQLVKEKRISVQMLQKKQQAFNQNQ